MAGLLSSDVAVEDMQDIIPSLYFSPCIYIYIQGLLRFREIEDI